MRLFTIEQIEAYANDYLGCCIDCGAARNMCEPDAQQIECEECGRFSVYGTAELYLMGLVDPE